MVLHPTGRTLLALVLLLLLAGSAVMAEEQCNSDDGTCQTDPSSDCKDLHDKCPEWKNDGECIANPTFMLHECKSSCGVCGSSLEDGVEEQECTDEMDGCDTVLERGRCETELVRCRKTCKTCVQSTADFGPEQEVEGADETAQTKVIIRESIAYMRDMRQTRGNQKIAQCQNTHKLCSFWAGIGECKKNPAFMNTDCAPACQTCYLIDIRARCPMDPDAEDILKPGDLNTWFERLTGPDSDFAEYNPTALSRPLKEGDKEGETVGYQEGPWVVTFDKIVSDEEVDRLLYHGNNTGYERSSDVGKVKHDGTHDSKVSQSRTSENAWCGKDCQKDPVIAGLIQKISDVTNTPRENSEDLQLLRYEPGQYYVQHHDYIEHQLERPCGVRIYTLFLYLNDVEEGGETSFPELDLMVTPSKGKAVLWPSVLDEAPNEKDGRTEHEAMSVTKGIKFGANAWIHMGDFQTALEKNCHN